MSPTKASSTSTAQATKVIADKASDYNCDWNISHKIWEGLGNPKGCKKVLLSPVHLLVEAVVGIGCSIMCVGCCIVGVGACATGAGTLWGREYWKICKDAVDEDVQAEES